MPWFYVDDAFADSKPVMALDPSLRNEAVGLWVRCGAWSAKEETDGHVPLDIVRGFNGTPRLIRALHNPAELWVIQSLERTSVQQSEQWRKSREILFGNWAKWQPTSAELLAKRKADADRQREWRANNPGAKPGPNRKGRGVIISDDGEMSRCDEGVTEPAMSQRDSAECHAVTDPVTDPVTSRAGARVGVPVRADPTRPDLKRDNSPNEEHSPNVGVERGLTDPVNPTASRLVAALISNQIPSAVRTGLRLTASQLINGDGVDPAIVAEALRRWLAKPGAGYGLLPSLASDVVRERAAPNGKPHKLRTLAELTQRERAAEQAALAAADPKGIE